MTSTDEFALGEATAPPRRRTPMPWKRSGVTWVAAGLALIIAGVLTSSGPIYPPLGDGIRWNISDLDLSVEPIIAWTAELPAAASPIGRVDDVMVFVHDADVAAEGEDLPARTVVGVDMATGAVQWQIDDPDRTCQVGDGGVTCVADPASPAALVTVHSAAGEVDRHIELPGAITALALADGGLLVVEGGGTALAELVRRDADGVALWSSTLSFSGLAEPGYAELAATGRIGSVSGGRRFDLTTGDQIGLGFEQATDGTTRRRPPDTGATSVRFSDGQEVRVPPGEMWLPVDDAFGGDVSLMFDGEGAVVATADGGRSTATIPEGTGWPFARLQDVLLIQQPDPEDPSMNNLIGIDQRTGDLAWERPELSFWINAGLDLGGLDGVVASADTLLVPLDGSLEAIDPRTGTARWSIPTAGEGTDVLVVDGAVLLVSGQDVSRLEWPAAPPADDGSPDSTP